MKLNMAQAREALAQLGRDEESRRYIFRHSWFIRSTWASQYTLQLDLPNAPVSAPYAAMPWREAALWDLLRTLR